MPTYDFVCGCGNAVTIVQRIDEQLTPPICINCQSVMPRDYGTPLIQFNGSGYYTTDK